MNIIQEDISYLTEQETLLLLPDLNDVVLYFKSLEDKRLRIKCVEVDSNYDNDYKSFNIFIKIFVNEQWEYYGRIGLVSLFDFYQKYKQVVRNRKLNSILK